MVPLCCPTDDKEKIARVDSLGKKIAADDKKLIYSVAAGGILAKVAQATAAGRVAVAAGAAKVALNPKVQFGTGLLQGFTAGIAPGGHAQLPAGAMTEEQKRGQTVGFGAAIAVKRFFGIH